MNEIVEYNSKDEQNLKEYYVKNENKNRTSRILHALKQRESAKRVWKAGIIGIFGIHVSQWMRSQFTIKNTSLFFLELLFWSAGISIVCFRKLRQEYSEVLIQSSITITEEFESIKNYDTSKAWVMKSSNGAVIGTVAFKYDQEEGKIGYLTAEDKNVRLKLLQYAFSFGRKNNIKVISKWRHDTLDSKWSESGNDFF